MTKVLVGGEEAKMSRNKTKNKIKKQEGKKDKIEKNRGDKPTGIDDVTHRNQKGCVD